MKSAASSSTPSPTSRALNLFAHWMPNSTAAVLDGEPSRPIRTLFTIAHLAHSALNRT